MEPERFTGDAEHPEAVDRGRDPWPSKEVRYRMKIGFDVSQTGSGKAGCGFFADGLIRSLAETDSRNQYFLYPAVGDHFWDPECATSTFQSNRPNFAQVPAGHDFEECKAFWNSPSAEFETLLRAPDIFHANNFYCPSGFAHAKAIYTLYDLSFAQNPGWTTEANRLGCFHGVYTASTRADAMVAISKATRDDFVAMFPHYPAERIRVIYPGSRFEERTGVERPARFSNLPSRGFWLTVGTIEPRKNQQQLVDAHARLQSQTGRGMPLVLAGGRGWLMDDFERKLRDANIGPDQVMLTGYVDDAELRWLYENCFCFVFPSLYEGFGLPVLEAMKLGAPVICSNTSSLPEIVGAAGIQVAPETKALADAMLRMLEDDGFRESWTAAATERAGMFSWKRAAREVLELYDEALALPPLRSIPYQTMSHSTTAVAAT